MARDSRAGRRHAAVRLDDARPAAHEEERRLRLAVGRLGEQEPGAAGRPERVPDVAVGLLGPDQEAGPVGGLAVDPVELAQPVALGVDDHDAARPRLVHVLAPLLAQVAQQGRLVGAQVDDPGRVRLDRRAPAASPAARSAAPQRAVGVERAVGLDLGVDPEVATRARRPRADRPGPRP